MYIKYKIHNSILLIFKTVLPATCLIPLQQKGRNYIKMVNGLIFVRPLDFRNCAPPLEKLTKGTGYLLRVPQYLSHNTNSREVTNFSGRGAQSAHTN